MSRSVPPVPAAPSTPTPRYLVLGPNSNRHERRATAAITGRPWHQVMRQHWAALRIAAQLAKASRAATR